MFEVRELAAGYGSTAVVRDVNASLPSGSILAVLGPNGAGKTTLLTTIAGLLPRIGGDVTVHGSSLPSGRAAEANRAGVILVPDDRALFPSLSARENIEAARRKGSAAAREMLSIFPALEPRWAVPAGSLSGGEQQMVALARAVIQRPQVLLIDEMSMGLAPLIVETMLPVVRSIAETTGAVVVIVEQHVRLALEVADHAMVLVHGHVVLSGTAAALREDPGRLESAYLGTEQSSLEVPSPLPARDRWN